VYFGNGIVCIDKFGGETVSEIFLDTKKAAIRIIE
jgi:hypothetical protein